MQLWNQKSTRKALAPYIGHPSQVAGITPFQLADGPARGCFGVRFFTGSGLDFTVLGDRGMDISCASYNGLSLCWRSQAGDRSPAFYEPGGSGWLRTYFGGLLTTCGLTTAGAPSFDDGEAFGLHGRMNVTPAENIKITQEWQGNEYVLAMEGTVREGFLFGPDLAMTRRISTRMGAECFRIEDRVENFGCETTPHMLLYHINLGFPFLDENAEFLGQVSSTEPRDARAKAGLKEWRRFQKPTKRFVEQVFYHDPIADKNGFCASGLWNPALNSGKGLGIYVRYRKAELPNLVQWKMMGLGAYVLGIEPANCRVEGRAAERERGTLLYLKPGEIRNYIVEIGVLQDKISL